MSEEKYCIYCGESEKEIREENRQLGYRVPCDARGTKKGFHSFGIRCSVCKRNWRKCNCKNSKDAISMAGR